MSPKALRSDVVLLIVMLIVLFTGGWIQSQRAENRHWEYSHLELSSSQEGEFESRLNQAGGTSWELVAVEREQSGGTVHFYFKRRR
jgi:hypothetical protein